MAGKTYRFNLQTNYISDQSLCEYAERKMRCTEDLLLMLSAPDSPFGIANQLVVERVSDGSSAVIPNLTTCRQLKSGLPHFPSRNDRTSSVAPTEIPQTILLKDLNRFERTGIIERRGTRRVFRERESGNLYYVDNGHAGGWLILKDILRSTRAPWRAGGYYYRSSRQIKKG